MVKALLLIHANGVLHGVDHAATGATRFVGVLGTTGLVGHTLTGRLGAVRLTLAVNGASSACLVKVTRTGWTSLG